VSGVDDALKNERIALLIIGVGILVAVMGCASPQDRERRALSGEFDKWLGQYKDGRIIERGPPDRCVAQGGGSEICEWRVDGNTVRYLYDANGIARRWKYADRQLGEMKGPRIQPPPQIRLMNQKRPCGRPSRTPLTI